MIIHLALVYDVDRKQPEPPEMRKFVVETVNGIFKSYIGQSGYKNNKDFYFNVLFCVLQNSKEREMVLVKIFTFLFESLLQTTDMLSNEFRYYSMMDVCNLSIDKMR